MTKKDVGVLGATSLVGDCLMPLLVGEGWRVVAFSRRTGMSAEPYCHWRQLAADDIEAPLCGPQEQIHHWISLAPIGDFPCYFKRLEKCGARRVVTLSSTSRFTKINSADPGEVELVRRMVASENELREWAEARGIEWVILRPTLIYGQGRDRNITEIARFIKHFGFFPLFGQAKGLRQPIYAGDVASTCLAALVETKAANRAYNISGAETLSYRDMVERVFQALGVRPRFVRIPLPLFRLAVACLRCLPRYRSWTTAMAERMNLDMTFDHASAAEDLHFTPRRFDLDSVDLPG